MSRNSIEQYRLTPAAQNGLEEIWFYSAQAWSPTQADRYTDALEEALDRLLAMPEIARERLEFTPPVRIQPCAEHLIVYRIEEGFLSVLRVLGGRQDWQAILRAIDQ